MDVNCKIVSEKAMREAMLIQIINHVCEKHGCRATINFELLTINIDGPESKREAIARDLDKWFG